MLDKKPRAALAAYGWNLLVLGLLARPWLKEAHEALPKVRGYHGLRMGQARDPYSFEKSRTAILLSLVS
jgi:hypothetical protein